MEEEINLKEILNGIWKRKIIIIIITIIAFIFGFLCSTQKIELTTNSENKKIFARTSFTVAPTEDYKITETTANTYQKIIKSTHNMESIVEKLNLDIEPKKLAESLQIIRIDYSDVIEISVINEELVENSEDILNEVLNIINSEIQSAYSIDSIYVIETPIIVNSNISNETRVQENDINIKKIFVITLAGFIIGMVCVIGLEIIDGTIKNEKQIINDLKISNLAIISSKQTETQNQDEFRKIKLNLKNNKSVLITSLINNDRKNEIVNGLTNLYSKYGKKVSIIDITEESLDIYNVKQDENGKYKKIKIEEKNNNLVEVLETERIREILEDLNNKFDIILINANNIFESVNSLAMSKFVDGTICVVEERKTKLKSLENIVQNLEKIDAKFIGTIISKK